MSLLARYVLRQNLFFLLLLCAVGIGIYVFIDLFDRLDNFLEAGVPFRRMGLYYVYRIPFILAQIFPAVFLLSLMTQLGLMIRNKELLALQACAVSSRALIWPLLCYALVLCALQFFFSQALGTAGHKAATRIWEEEVRNRSLSTRTLSDVWFREGEYIVHLEKVSPVLRTGENATVYILKNAETAQVEEILRSRHCISSAMGWTFMNVTRSIPASFCKEDFAKIFLDLHTDVRGYQAVDPKARMDSLSFWQLGREIARLRHSGSNIERLETAWHMKLSYAFSLMIMALVGLAVLSRYSSLYIVIPVGLLVTFGYYVIFMFCVSAGENGIFPPVLAAWMANIIFSSLSILQLFWARSLKTQ